MSDEHQWKQLGSVVNAVLMQARTQAMRNGAISQVAAAGGFLEASQPVPPHRAQLELPLDFNADASRFGDHPFEPIRGVRLM